MHPKVKKKIVLDQRTRSTAKRLLNYITKKLQVSDRMRQEAGSKTRRLLKPRHGLLGRLLSYNMDELYFR